MKSYLANLDKISFVEMKLGKQLKVKSNTYFPTWFERIFFKAKERTTYYLSFGPRYNSITELNDAVSKQVSDMDFLDYSKSSSDIYYSKSKLNIHYSNKIYTYFSGTEKYIKDIYLSLKSAASVEDSLKFKEL